MIRLLGLLLVASGAVWMGFQAQGRLRQTWRELEWALEGLGDARRRLMMSQPPTPELLEGLGEGRPGEMGRLFRGCARELEKADRPPMPRLWRQQLRACPCLWRAARGALAPLGDVLGRVDCQEQCRVLEQAEAEVRQALAHARQEDRRMGRVYRALGLSGGAFLVILLL